VQARRADGVMVIVFFVVSGLSQALRKLRSPRTVRRCFIDHPYGMGSGGNTQRFCPYDPIPGVVMPQVVLLGLTQHDLRRQIKKT
jgi:hypothetical protein